MIFSGHVLGAGALDVNRTVYISRSPCYRWRAAMRAKNSTQEPASDQQGMDKRELVE
jgi:hypothetical protein